MFKQTKMAGTCVPSLLPSLLESRQDIMTHPSNTRQTRLRNQPGPGAKSRVRLSPCLRPCHNYCSIRGQVRSPRMTKLRTPPSSKRSLSSASSKSLRLIVSQWKRSGKNRGLPFTSSSNKGRLRRGMKTQRFCDVALTINKVWT